MTAETGPRGILASIRTFTGIDVVTIGVLAVLFRVVGIPLFRLTMAAFPYSGGVRFGIDVFIGVLAVVLVRKPGTLFAYALTWWLINFIGEGEDLVWLIGMWWPMLAGEWYLSSRRTYAGSFKDVLIGVGILYGFFFALIWWILLVTFYALVYPPAVIAASVALIAVAVVVASWLGWKFANRLRPLTR
jgi:hypothetical protein